MRTFWRGIVRTLFWSYDRGSWPYDLMVLVILLFVLATPRSWFRDWPAVADASAHCIQLISNDPLNGSQIYRLDASCLPVSHRKARSTPEMEKWIHDLLSRSAPALAGRTFQVQSIQAQLDSSGAIRSYDIYIRRQ